MSSHFELQIKGQVLKSYERTLLNASMLWTSKFLKEFKFDYKLHYIPECFIIM